VYSNGALVVNWVASYSAYPVIDGDMAKLTEKGNYGNYDAHFIPVVAKNPNNAQAMSYYPTKPNQNHTYTEMVVFESAQCLPRYLVELQLSLPKALAGLSISSVNLDTFFPSNHTSITPNYLLAAAHAAYQHCLSKPYSLAQHQGKDWTKMDWQFSDKGITISRPNHGLAHTLRSMAYAPYVVEAYIEYHEDDLTVSKTKALKASIAELQLALLFFVAGRENEMSSFNDAIVYKRFRENSALWFEKYVQYSQLNLPADKLALYKDAIIKSSFTISPIHSIMKICHDLDTMRCMNKQTYGLICNDIAKQIGQNHTERLQELVWLSLITTGDRVLAKDESRDYDADKFITASTDPSKCLAQIQWAIKGWKQKHGL
jgi:hypothetical protein